MRREHVDAAAELLATTPRPRRHIASIQAARRFLTASLARDGEHNLVALCGGTVVGYTCAIRPRGRLAGCGPLAVHPEHVGTELEPQLLMQTIKAALEHRVGLLRLPMALHRLTFDTVYRGMKLDLTGETYIRLERRPDDLVPIPDHHEAIVVHPDDIERIAIFDRERFVNADRSDDLRLALEHLDTSGWILERDGEMRAFVFAIRGLGIGPLAAIDREAATDALRIATAFEHRWGRPSSVHIAATDRDLLEEALRLGYSCREPVFMFERSFDGTYSPIPRGPYCLSPLGVP